MPPTLTAAHRSGEAPTDTEISRRRKEFHAPYHDALTREIERVRRRHGLAIVYDCHSIRSRIPYLFEGTLPVFNIGTNDGATCAAAVAETVATACSGARGFTTVVNGRFRGGWTTRHYGDPGAGVHALQMELAQRVYMDETPPWDYDAGRAETVRKVLQSLLERLRTLALSGELERSL